MDLHNINTIARYEVKLLRRSWLFRIFATLALLGITLSVLLLLTPLINTYSAQWPLRAVSSQIPYFSTALYNIAQSIIVVFLAGSFLKRDRKLDTAEVIYVRPMSNADYIIGKTWGIVKVFLALQAIVLLITLFLHVTLTQSPFSIFPYVFYLFTVSLPSLLFMLGLSYTAMCLLKNQAVTFVVMLGLVGLEFFYIKDSCYGVFDFFGRNIPALFSDVTGHVDLPHFLLQRFIYLTAGIGLICFTIALVKRLPHRPWKLVVVHSLGVAFVVIALAAGLLYVRHYHQLNASRQEYIATFNRYANAPRVNICKNDLSITPSGNRLEGESRMELENRSGQRIEEIVLYLNPSLSVQSAANEQGTMTYHRERQVIVLKHALNPGEKTTVTLHYQGGIDEAICYTDILEKDYWDNTDPQHTFSLGKQYAWLEEDFTLLTPECLWYPVAIPPVNPEAPYNLLKDFTHYTLTVNYDGGKTVLSQGEAEQQAGKTVFRNRTALPCISLTIADYDKKSLRVDSVDYEILYFKGHDYFSSHFALLQDTLPGLIRELKNDKETKQGRDYPFRRFTLAETPAQHHSYVRNWKGHTEYVLPEIVFIPERGIRLNSDFQSAKIRTESWLSHREGNPAPLEVTISVFNNFLQNTLFEEITQYERDWSQKYVNQFSARPLFYHHAGFIRANDYPILDISLNMMQDNDVELRGLSGYASSVMPNAPTSTWKAIALQRRFQTKS